MAFYLSPSVNVFERDLTSIVPAVSTSIGAFAGAFSWGPVEDPVTISSENLLAQRFGKPTDSNFQSFFTAANFLSYSNNLLLVRADATGLKNSVSKLKTSSIEPSLTTSIDSKVVSSDSSVVGYIQVGDIVRLSTGTLIGTVSSISQNGLSFELKENALISVTSDECVSYRSVKVKNENDYLENYHQGGNGVGPFAAKYPGTQGNALLVSMCDSQTYSSWEYKLEFDGAPNTSDYADRLSGSNDELHIVVVDRTGEWTGTPGSIIEKFAFVSKALDASKSDGTNNYYKNVLNQNSKYVWWMDHPEDTSNWGTHSQGVEFDSLNDSISSILGNGADDYSVSVIPSYEILSNDELYDISLVISGMASPIVSRYIIQNVAESRKDCVAFISPSKDGSPIIGNGSDAVEDILSYKNELNVSSSYAVMDTGCKYQYDRYNDVYRWVPLNGDIAGLCARTDYTNDAWWSPAGYNRGQIKNVIKLAVNPGKTERDNLYKAGINPVVNFPGNGVVLFGDKTLLAKPSAFDRINVRRLFIVLEKAIATAAKYQLFEFNDGFTRAQFKNLVEPFLRDVQGRRGIIDFRVKCDETNNTGEVVDRNEFVADIYLKPNRSINYITLNFVAARTSISFEEIGA